MHVRCPICDRPLEIPHADDDTGTEFGRTLSSVPCPNCGLVAVQYDPDPTHTFRREPERANTQIGHFKLLRTLGRGASGEVWLAEDLKLGRQAALKLPRPHGDDLKHLLFEAKTAASLRHPNIVSVYEVGDEDGRVYIASEFIDGLTLRDLLSSGKPALTRALELLTAISRALHYAHQHGIVHRDVKPSNILINRDGQPYVTDFGLAKRIHADATISSEGAVLGTARYMSPEQAAGRTRETDHRSDIYAIGVMLFEMLTGDVPFRGNMRAILHQKIYEEPPSPRTLDRTLPRDLETICLKCLERQPEKRYGTALEVAEEFARFTAGEPIRARPISRLERTWRWCRKRPAVAGLLAGLFLSLSIGLAGVTYFWRQSEQSAVAARQSLYRSWMNLASIHLNQGDTAGVKDMLARIAADPGMDALRGFEWDYYGAVTEPMSLVANPGDVVGDVAISRDGGLVAAVVRDPEVRVWDAGTGELVQNLSTGTASMTCIDFSTTGQLVAGSVDGHFYVWDPLRDVNPVYKRSHGPPVALVRFSPDGKQVLSAGAAGAVRLFNAAQEKAIRELPSGQGRTIKDARFFADGTKLLVATADGRIRLWDLVRPQDTPELQLETVPELEAAAVSDDGQLLVVGDYHGGLTILRSPLGDGSTSTSAHESTWGRIDDIEFLAGTHIVAVASADGQTHLFDVDTQRELRALNTHSFTFGCLARAANGAFLVVGGGDAAVTRLTLAGLTNPAILWQDKPVRDVEFLSDGRLAVACENGELHVRDLATANSEHWNSGDEHPTARTISVQPGGTLVAAAGNQPVVELWDAAAGKVVRTLPVSKAGATVVQFSHLGRQLAVAHRADPEAPAGVVQIYRTDELRKQPDDMRAAVPAQSILPAGEGQANALAFSPDDRRLVAAWSDGRIDLVDPAGGPAREPSLTIKTAPWSLAFCDGGKTLAIGTNTGEIHLWDLAAGEGRVRTVIKGHTGRINAMAALPGGQTLVSGGRDRRLKLWDVATGELITSLTGHRKQVFTIRVSPDGGIVSGGLEGDVRMWTGFAKK